MAWAYNDYEEQTTAAAKAAQLRRHISEVNAAILENVTIGGRSVQVDHLTEYKKDLVVRLREFEKSDPAAIRSDDARVTSGFTRGRPL